MSSEPIFFRRKDCIDMDAAAYLRDMLYRVLKVGVELEFALPKGVMRERFQPQVARLLQPTKDLGALGSLGVFDVVSDHSGVEVQVVGRRPHWGALLKQYRWIVGLLLPLGIRMPATCGLHYHLLCLDMCEELDEIVLANLWNLCRKYAPGLKFLTSCGPGGKGLCRRRQHNAHQEFLRLSPATLHMSAIQAELRRSLDVPEHQNFFNLEHVCFTESGAVRDLHLEMRFPDGNLSPTAITAQTFLFFALLLKAVEISQYGLLHVGKVREWRRKQELMDILSNNDGSLATSDTSRATPEVIQELRDNAQELLDFIHNQLASISGEAHLVLGDLGREPVSLRRGAGKDWLEIEADLLGLVKAECVRNDLLPALCKVVEMGLVTRAPGPDQWRKQAALKINSTTDVVRDGLDCLSHRMPVWDHDLGTMLFQR